MEQRGNRLVVIRAMFNCNRRHAQQMRNTRNVAALAHLRPVRSAGIGERIVLLANFQAHAVRTAALARHRSAEGADDFGAVLDAERQRMEVEDSLAGSRQQALNSAIALYSALGGAAR